VSKRELRATHHFPSNLTDSTQDVVVEDLQR
jgi:hypothetical protein